MKKINIFLCIAAIFFLITGVQESHAVRKQKTTPSSVQPGTPDLKAAVKFGKIIDSKSIDGVQCYNVHPYFTITNKGKGIARNFDYTIEAKIMPTFTWIATYIEPNASLKPGATITIDGSNVIIDHNWCVNDIGTLGYRITVDSKDAVKESNENNNVAEKIFIPPVPKIESPKVIEKDYQKIPIKSSELRGFNPQPEPPVESRQPQTVKRKRSSSQPQLRSNQIAADLKPTQDIGKPSIWFDLSTQPAPSPKLNQPFSLVIGLKNIGSAENGPPNQVVVRLACTPLSKFGDCQQLLGDPVVPVIKPGQKDSLHLSSVFKITQPGTYRVSMTLDPAPTTKGLISPLLKKNWSKEFSVSGLKKIIKPVEVEESKNIMPGSEKMMEPLDQPSPVIVPVSPKTIDPGDDGYRPGSEKMDEEELFQRKLKTIEPGSDKQAIPGSEKMEDEDSGDEDDGEDIQMKKIKMREPPRMK